MSFLPLLLAGALVTVKISASALVAGSFVGLLLGVLATSRRRPAVVIVTAYVEIVRSTPFIILLFFVFYGMPLALDIDISPMAAAILSLTLYCSAFMTEVVRSGLGAVRQGQRDAAAALGLTPFQAFGSVVLPQAMKVMMPAGVNVAISTLKESALASSIGFMELLGSGLAVREQTINQGGSNALLLVALIYFVLCFALSLLGEYALGRRHA